MLWSLFITFFKIGLISFGGGYAMIPVIQQEVQAHRWLSEEVFVDTVALAGMTPGPIATNCATLIGYKTDGLLGAVAATSGIMLPSIVFIVLIAAFFYKVHRNKWIRASFYGLRPVVTGLIVYAAIHFGLSGDASGFTWRIFASVFIVAVVIIGVMKYKFHPLAAIVLSGLLGIVFFQA